MFQELSSGIEDYDSEDISSHFFTNDPLEKTALNLNTQDNHFSQSYIFTSAFLNASDLSFEAFDNLEQNIKLLKNESKVLNEQIKALRPKSTDKVPVPVCPSLSLLQVRLERLDEILKECGRNGSGNDVNIEELLMIFSNIILGKNLMQSSSHSSIVKSGQNEAKETEGKIADVKKQEVAKRNKIEADFTQQITALQLQNTSLNKQLQERMKQIEEFRKQVADDSCAQSYNNAKNLEHDLHVLKMDHKAQLEFLQQQLEDQVEERQKNDYRAIFLEDKVAMLTMKNRKLNDALISQRGYKETATNSTQTNNDQLEDVFSKRSQVATPKQISSTANDGKCLKCEKLLLDIQRLEKEVDGCEKNRLQVEQKITNLLKEKVDMSDRLCQAGRINCDLKKQLEIQLKETKNAYEKQIEDMQCEKSQLEDENSKQKVELIKVENQVAIAENRVKEANNQCEQFKQQFEAFTNKFNGVLESQMQLNADQQKIMNTITNPNNSHNHGDNVDAPAKNREEFLVKISNLEQTIQQSNYNNQQLSSANNTLLQQVHLLQTKLSSKNQKLSACEQKKTSHVDRLVHKYYAHKIKFHKKLAEMQIKLDEINSSLKTTKELLNASNEKFKCQSQQINALEMKNIVTESQLQDRNSLIQIKTVEIDKMAEKYQQLLNRLDSLKAENVNLKIECSEKCGSNCSNWTNQMQEHMSLLCSFSQLHIKNNEDSKSAANSSYVTDQIEIEHLRSQNTQLNQTIQSFRSDAKTKDQQIQALINKSQNRAMSILSLSTNPPMTAHDIGLPLFTSSPSKKL